MKEAGKATSMHGTDQGQAVRESGLHGSRRHLLMGGAAVLAGAGLLTGRRAESQTLPPGPRVFDVREYGLAKGDGETDDSQALYDTMLAAWREGGVVYFPPGRYLCHRKLAFSQTPTEPNTPSISLVGDGRGVSCIEFIEPPTGANDAGVTNPSAYDLGIELRFANADRQLRVSGLTLKAATARAGTALSFWWPHDNGPYARAHIEDVEICPRDITHHYWDYGLRLSGAHLSVIRAVWCRGKSGNRQSACAIDLTNSNDVSISDCHTNFTDIAINVDGGSAFGDPAGCEGTVIRDCYMVNHNIGVRSFSDISGGLPWVEVSSSHIFASYRGIQVRNRNEATFTHNVIYQADALSTFVAIECQDNCTEATIHHNKLVHLEGAPNYQGIVHSGQHSQVNHNVGTMSPCVVLRNQAKYCVAVGNISRTTTGAAVLDEPMAPGVPANNHNTVALNVPS